MGLDRVSSGMNVVKVYSEVLGKEVSIPEEPRRIVSLAPAITETLFLLGLKERIAGVSHFCNKPKEAREKPRLGSYFQVNYKKLEELNPDLILVTTGAQRKLALELDEKGYTVYPIPLPVSLPGIIDMVLQAGIVTGKIEEARELSQQLITKLSNLQALTGNPRVYYEIDLGGPVSIGAHNYINDALARIGLRNIFSSERTTWIISPDPEAIVERDPEIIIYEKAPYKKYEEEKILESFKKRGLDKTTAYKESNIMIIEPDSLAHYGPSLVDVIRSLSREIKERINR